MESKLQATSEIFNEAYYRDNYRTYEWDALAHEFRATATLIRDTFLPKKALDVGCATGHLVRALREREVEAWGLDASGWATGAADESVSPYLTHGLIQQLPFRAKSFDTVICFDVLEHIPEEDADRACAELMRVASRYLILNLITLESADYTDPTHITVKPKQWWIDKLTKLGGTVVPYEHYGAPVWWFNVPERSIVIKL
jgi:2-polyprenyl-3-methyl-5-hydroxy-6-metoxy-1,4-benzoquinol methylase